MKSKLALLILSCFSSLLMAADAPQSQQAEETPAHEKVYFEQKIGSVIPLQTQLTDAHGEQLPISLIAGDKPHILVFSYYRCPNLCTLVLNGLVESMKKLPQKLGKDFDVITVSINPEERSSLALMKQRSYLARYGQTSTHDWHFLVGQNASIRALTYAAGFHYEKDSLSGEYNHPSGIIVLSPKGKIIRYLFGIQYDPKTLSESLDDAKLGRIGSLAEEILLYCFHYSPSANKNGRAVLAVVRLVGFIGAIGLLVLLIHLSRTRRSPIA
ncbi:MAG: SCO family protein [Bdellovibrionia bacterium]